MKDGLTDGVGVVLAVEEVVGERDLVAIGVSLGDRDPEAVAVAEGEVEGGPMGTMQQV
jgi:hypothetical protein